MYNQFFSGSSLIHQLDPRTKIIAVIALSLIIMQITLKGLMLASAFILLCTLASGIPIVILLNALRPAMPLFIILFFIYVLFTAGTAIFSFGPIQVSVEGLKMGVLQVGKFTLLICAASLLTMSTPAASLTTGLEHLLRPFNKIGGSSYEIALMIALALRFVPVLLEEMKSINEAQLSRNSNADSIRLGGKTRAMINLSLPLALNYLRRCDNLAEAMESRGFKPGPRTNLYELSLTLKDYYLIISFILVLFFIYLV